jgi:hypothetical protein
MSVSESQCALDSAGYDIANAVSYVPWEPSWMLRLFPEGMARAPLSLPLVAFCGRGCH